MVLSRKRGLLALAAALAFAFSLAGCAGGAKAAPIAPQASVGEKRTVTIFGSSDIHGYFLPWDYATDAAFPTGGLSKIATVVARERATNPNVVVVDAGDLIQGNFAEGFKAEKENPMMKGLNAIGYDVFVPGNHEFNFGMSVLNNTLKTFKGKALGGNIHTASGKPFLPAYTIVERGGVKVGIIGMADRERGIAIHKQEVMEGIAKAIFDGQGPTIYPREDQGGLAHFAEAITKAADGEEIKE